MSIMKNKIVQIILFSISLNLYSTNYYVSKSGNDSNDGSVNSSFLTIAKASSKMIAGDTCFIKEGVYRETLQPAQNGQAAKPIVYTCFQQDSVVISATEVVSSWQKHKGDIYRTKFTMPLSRQNMVFCDGEAMDWARWPNNTDNDKFTPQGVQVISGDGSTFENSSIPNLNWIGGYVWYLGGHAGTSWTRQITSTSAGKINFVGVDITKWPFNPHNPTIVRNNSRGQFYIFGVMDALDYPGEWYFNSTKDSVYFQAPGNVDPSTLNIEIAKRSTAINLNKSYIHIIGLNVFGGKINISSSYCVVKNGTIKDGMHVLDEFNNTDAQTPEASIYISASNTLIENNKIIDGSLNAIYIQNTASFVTIRQNLIKNFDYYGIHASPIRSGASYTTIYGNTIIKTGRDGIYCGSTNCEIAYNDVSGCMQINNDGGMFYTVGNTTDKNNVIHHNWFHDSFGPSYADGRVAGIYLDNNSKGYVVHHNVVWNNTWPGVQVNWDNWNIDIFNNTFFNCTAAMGRWENGYTISDLVVKNNYSSVGSFIGTDISSTSNVINAIYPFISVVNRDFRPVAGSNLIDNGEIISGITDGYQDSKPDIGAYESKLIPWRPGVNFILDGTVDDINNSIDFVESVDVKVFPNPLHNGNLNIDFAGSENNSISIYTVCGKQIYNTTSNLNKLTIDRSKFPQAGMYIARIISKGLNYSQKIIVE